MNKNNLFLLKKNSELFAKNGYVVVPNFLSESEISQLKKNFHEETTELKEGFYRTLDSENKAYKESLCNNINAIFTPKVNDYLTDYRYLLSSFMVKQANTKTPFDLHQNWNFVDENRFTSVAVWVPLVDSSIENGTMHVIEKTHRLHKTFRGGPNIPSIYRDIIEDIKDQYGKAIELKAGDAIFFDDALLHYTTPNLTNEARLAIAQVMIPKLATPIYYYQDIEDYMSKIHEFEIDNDFYLYFINRYKTTNPPTDCKLINTHNVDLTPLTFDDFVEQIKNV